jgi:hypothetical protein
MTSKSNRSSSDFATSVEEKYPIIRQCRRLSSEAGELAVAMLIFVAGPTCAVGFWSHGLRREIWFGLGIVTVVFFVGRYLGARWALQSVCASTTERYLDGSLVL